MNDFYSSYLEIQDRISKKIWFSFSSADVLMICRSFQHFLSNDIILPLSNHTDFTNLAPCASLLITITFYERHYDFPDFVKPSGPSRRMRFSNRPSRALLHAATSWCNSLGSINYRIDILINSARFFCQPSTVYIDFLLVIIFFILLGTINPGISSTISPIKTRIITPCTYCSQYW